MPTILGKEKSLTRDGAGTPLQAHSIDPKITTDALLTIPIEILSGETYTLSTLNWTSIRFRSNLELYVTCENSNNEKTMEFPEIPNIPIIYVLSYINTLYFENKGSLTATLYIQGM